MGILRGLLCALMIITTSPAEELYIWTDSEGVTHIRQTPAPPNARHQEVIQYTPQTPSEIEAIRQRREAMADRYQKEAILENARIARREAEEARQRAEEARLAAGAAEERLEEFKKKVGPTIRRQQLNRGTLLRLEADALAARNEALEASQNADLAAKRATEAEEKAHEVLGQAETDRQTPLEPTDRQRIIDPSR